MICSEVMVAMKYLNAVLFFSDDEGLKALYEKCAANSGKLLVRDGVLKHADLELVRLRERTGRRLLAWAIAHTAFSVRPGADRDVLLTVQKSCPGVKEQTAQRPGQ